MRIFYVDNIRPERPCIIEGSEARHIYKVLRMGKGDEILLMDSNGRRYRAVIEDIRKGKVYALIKESIPEVESSPIEITVCISMIRSDPMDLVIQKVSELGAERVIPFYSERSIVRIPEEKVDSRLRHWKEVAISASKQCGRKRPLEIVAPISLDELLEREWEDYLLIFLWEHEKEKTLREILIDKRGIKKIVGIIGPEGGFSKKEADMLKEKGFIPATLGKRILRAETAAIVFVAIVQYELGDLSYQMEASSPMGP